MDQPHLCATCLRLLRAVDRSTSAAGRRKENIASTNVLLEDSAKNGCPLCLLFLNSLPPSAQHIMKDHYMSCQKDNTIWGTFKTTYVVGNWDEGDREGGLLEDSFRVFLSNDLGGFSNDSRIWTSVDFHPKKHDLPYLESNTSSASSLDTAMKWFNNCSVKHDICNSRLTAFLPSRMIFVENDEDGNPLVRLALRDKILSSTVPSYVTLSHCWGQHIPIKLLRENLEHFITGIDFDLLPKTFQDTILVAQRLNISYIWIDSLCIIQDSVEDWQAESALMGQIYSNCTLNIAAAGASDGSVGLFFERDIRLVKPVEVIVGDHQSINAQIYHVADQDLCYAELTTYGDVLGFRTAPLTTRAWVCQERLTSPRTLHFGISQLFWECKESCACETLPEGDNIGPWLMSTKKRLSQIEVYDVGKPSINRAHEQWMFNTWRMILEMYTSANLTFDTDKLVAISGLASIIQTRLGVDYFAGIWNQEIPLQLLWKTFPHGMAERHSCYVAPSWSWASVNGACETEYYQANHKYQVDILEISVTTTGSNSLGQVKDGSLRLRGRLFEVHIGASHQIYSQQTPFLRFDGIITKDQSFHSTSEKIELFSDVFLADQGSTNFEMKMLLLPIMQIDNNMELGLVLERVIDDNESIRFSRWGWYRSLEPQAGSTVDKYCNFFDALLQEQSGLKKIRDVKGNLRYEITII